MKIQLTGICSEITGTPKLEINPVDNVNKLKEYLISSYPELATYPFKVSINSKLAVGGEKLTDKDVILIFGAYAGG